jgi:hypothetical protein
MSIFCRLSRRHYWCTPHRSADNQLVQVCYECGAERPVREIHNDFTVEKSDIGLAVYRNESKAYPRVIEEAPEAVMDRALPPERIAVGEKRVRKFAVVK